MPAPIPISALCPACRAIRPAQQVGAAVVRGQPHTLLQCHDRACELVWAQRADTQPAASTAA